MNLDINILREAAAQGRIQWHHHALERFLERGLSRAEVMRAIMNGEVVEIYPGDRPYPSCLIFTCADRAGARRGRSRSRRSCVSRDYGLPTGPRSFRTGLQNQEEKAMRNDLGRCPLCGGEKHAGTTTFAVDLKFGVVVVRGVPAFVCEKCGDAWIDDPVAAKLENIVADARLKNAVVEVTQWQQAAA
jgi:YgiT-type zinc finger domain-containing protein